LRPQAALIAAGSFAATICKTRGRRAMIGRPRLRTPKMTRTAAFRAAAPLFLLAALPAQGPAADKHLLRYRFTAGKESLAVLAQKVTVKRSVAGQSVETTMDIRLFLTTLVTEAKDGGGTVRFTFDRVKVAAKSPARSIDHDSDVKSSEPGQFPGLADVLGKSMEMRLDARGAVLDVRMSKELESAARGMQFDEMVRQQLLVLPEKEVAIGESWESGFEMPSAMGKGKWKVANRLRQLDGARATVEQRMQIDASGLKLPPDAALDVQEASGTTVADLACWSLPEVANTMALDTKTNGVDMHMDLQSSVKAAPAPEHPPAGSPAKGDDKPAPK
jgi:hypothetical protein